VAERFRGKSDGERTSRRDPAGAPLNAGEEPDVEAFLRQPRLSLTDEYWRPVDSLVPVRLTDMTDGTVPAPSSRRRVRALDAVIAGVGLGAALLLAVLLLRKGDARPEAHAVQTTELRTRRAIAPATTAHAAAVAPPPAQALPANAAIAATTPVRTATEATPVQTAAEATPVQTSTPAQTEVPAKTVAASVPASAATSPSVSTDPASSAASGATASSTEPKPATKKRKRKHADHAPPTASFPDP
jgi:hypothetical protein